MKITYIIGILFICSCSSSNKHANNESDTKLKTQLKDSLMLPFDRYLGYEVISEKDYFSALSDCAKCTVDYENEKELIAKVSPKVKRYKNYLTIIGLNDKSISYENRDDASEDNYEDDKGIFYYFGKDNGVHIVFDAMVEYHEYIFIDQNNLEAHTTWGLPRTNTDSTKIIASNSDLNAGFTTNGLQFFEKKNDHWMKNWEIELDGIAIEDVVWIDPSTFYAVRRQTSDQDDILSYFKFQLK